VRETQSKGVRSGFFPRFVEISWILSWNLYLSSIFCKATIETYSYIYPCRFWGIQTSYYV